ncbi:MAG: serine/threonine-protein kinase [Polyangiaceae bacterium]
MAETVDVLLANTAYRAVRRLGKGRTGEVHVVRHQFLGRQFALKFLRPDLLSDAQFSDRLRVEAQSAARLQHPNIVEMVDLWISAEGYPCIVMELLQGKTLAEELSTRQRLPVGEAVDLAQQALSGLAAAHALGVVHRDVTPENLFLQEVPGFPRTLKLLDFGLARVLPSAPRHAPDPLAVPTKTGALLGSPRFMSPEAERGERVDHRSDLYSLGVVLYVMLTGHGPHDVPAPQVLPPSKFGADGVTGALDAIVLRSIQDSTASRYQAADEFLLDLKRLPRKSKHPEAQQ